MSTTLEKRKASKRKAIEHRYNMRLSLPLRSKEQKTRGQKYHFWQKGLWRGEGGGGNVRKTRGCREAGNHGRPLNESAYTASFDRPPSCTYASLPIGRWRNSASQSRLPINLSTLLTLRPSSSGKGGFLGKQIFFPPRCLHVDIEKELDG